MRRANLAAVVALFLAVTLAAACMLVSSGCTKGGTGSSGDSQVASDTPAPPEVPPPPMLREPRSAVYSYLLWISYAYRVANSEVAVKAFDPWEEVRVNSYVQLNKQNGRAIDQKLTRFDVKSIDTKEGTSTVAIAESWDYRYIELLTGRYNSPSYSITYDSTYTVLRQPNGEWLVHKVEAAPRGEVE